MSNRSIPISGDLLQRLNNNENDHLIPQGFVDGSITVTGLNVAQVGDEEYETIGDAWRGQLI